MIEGDTRLYLLFNSMFDEVPSKKPYGNDPAGKINPLRKIASLSNAELLRIGKNSKTLTQRSVQRQGVIRPWAQYTAAIKAGADF